MMIIVQIYDKALLTLYTSTHSSVATVSLTPSHTHPLEYLQTQRAPLPES